MLLEMRIISSQYNVTRKMDHKNEYDDMNELFDAADVLSYDT